MGLDGWEHRNTTKYVGLEGWEHKNITKYRGLEGGGTKIQQNTCVWKAGRAKYEKMHIS